MLASSHCMICIGTSRITKEGPQPMLVISLHGITAQKKKTIKLNSILNKKLQEPVYSMLAPQGKIARRLVKKSSQYWQMLT